MAEKVQIFCKVRKRVIRVHPKVATALVKMHRATYDLPKPSAQVPYSTRMIDTKFSSPTLTPQPVVVPNPIPFTQPEEPAGSGEGADTTPSAAQEPETDDKQLYKMILDEAGVQYDGRWGEAKLKELVDGLEKNKTEGK